MSERIMHLLPWQHLTAFFMALMLSIPAAYAQQSDQNQCEQEQEAFAIALENLVSAIADRQEACSGTRVCIRACNGEFRVCRNDARVERNNCIQNCRNNFQGRERRICIRNCRRNYDSAVQQCRTERTQCREECREGSDAQCQEARQEVREARREVRRAWGALIRCQLFNR